LRAPAITLPGHREVYNAKCGRPQGGLSHMRTKADKRGDRKQVLLICGRPLWTTPSDIFCKNTELGLHVGLLITAGSETVRFHHHCQCQVWTNVWRHICLYPSSVRNCHTFL